MIQKVMKTVFGSQHERDLKALLPILHKINEKETWAVGLNDDQFPGITESFKERFSKGENPG